MTPATVRQPPAIRPARPSEAQRPADLIRRILRPARTARTAALSLDTRPAFVGPRLNGLEYGLMALGVSIPVRLVWAALGGHGRNGPG